MLNSQMDASRFLNVTEEVIDAIEENSIPKSTKMLLSLTQHSLKERYDVYAD